MDLIEVVCVCVFVCVWCNDNKPTGINLFSSSKNRSVLQLCSSAWGSGSVPTVDTHTDSLYKQETPINIKLLWTENEQCDWQ